MNNFRTAYPNELYHYGIKGQKWGVRRYQNPDGSLKAAGRKRYQVSISDMPKDIYIPAEAINKYSKQINALLKFNPYEGDGKYRVHFGNAIVKIDSSLVNDVMKQMNENPEILEQIANSDTSNPDSNTISSMAKVGEIATKSVAKYTVNQVKKKHKVAFAKAKSVCGSILAKIRKVIIKVKNKIRSLFD